MSTSPHYRDEGQGAPVVLIPGFGASVRSFDAVFDARGTQRLIAIDLPRTGKSKDWAPSTPVAIAEELSTWLKKHGVSEYRALGHSYGGVVAIELAHVDARHVESLIIASAPALGLPQDAKMFLANPMIDQVVMSMFQVASWRPVMRAYLQWLWGKPPLPATVIDNYIESIKAEGFATGIVQAMRGVADYRLPLEALNKSGVVARVIWGEKDPLVPVVYGEHLATSLKATFRVLPDVGHCVPEEQPQALVDEITGVP